MLEAARSLAGLAGADSREFSPGAEHCVIDLMPDQRGVVPKGGTMRLGAYPCAVAPGSLLEEAYGAREIRERHRHRYEFNNDYRERLVSAGVRLSGLSPDGRLVEAVELPGHPFFVGVQYHPEFKSRPNRAHRSSGSSSRRARAGRGAGEICLRRLTRKSAGAILWKNPETDERE
ncbi:MAG: glutamine amidotransferase-related protein [Anaerotruncus massiliensis (ex Togo et al. 2019)]